MTTTTTRTPAGSHYFREQTLYYRFEYGVNGRSPVISTWLYLGRQTLDDNEPTANGTKGYVFVLVPALQKRPAWNVSQTIWSSHDAQKTMRSWPDFAKFILTWRDPCCGSTSCSKADALGRALSVAVGAEDPPVSARRGDNAAEVEFSEGQFYYTALRSPDLTPAWPAVCGTCVCIKAPDSFGGTMSEASGEKGWSVALQDVFSRSLGPERFGVPFILKESYPLLHSDLTTWDNYRYQILRALGLPSGEKGSVAYSEYSRRWESLTPEEQDMLAGYLAGLDDEADIVKESGKYLEYIIRTRGSGDE